MYINTLVHRDLDPEIVQIAADHDFRGEAILEALQALQASRGGLTAESVEEMALALSIPAERAFGVATFFSMLSFRPDDRPMLRVCDGAPCWLRNSATIRNTLSNSLSAEFQVERTSCLGLCDRAPAALRGLDQIGPLPADPLTASQLQALPASNPSYGEPLPGEIRMLLAGATTLDPNSLESALEHGAYEGLQKALAMSPEEVTDWVIRAGLRGRGGAGFPAGQKWRLVAENERQPHFVVCNADESEPLVFKDRVLMDTNPHQILEGMAIAGYAVGAPEGIIYIRGEYEAQAAKLERAIDQARAAGWLGADIQGRGFGFEIHLHRGAGAYICGEETALLESLEGRRGEPRARPPYPTVNGYLGCPTVVNNVETLAASPAILRNGVDWYLSRGKPEAPGTRLYTLLGHVQRPGLFEASYRLTLRQVIDEFGNGLQPSSEFHFALVGGAAGTIVPPSQLDVPLGDPASSPSIPLGAGAILICDQTVSPLALVRELMYFFEAESCGKCTPCRIGTRQARKILDRLLVGEGTDQDRATLLSLAETLEMDSFCGLGIFASLPLKSAMAHFPDAFAPQ